MLCVARDLDNKLYMYRVMPWFSEADKKWHLPEEYSDKYRMRIDSSLMSNVTWENSPFEIKILGIKECEKPKEEPVCTDYGNTDNESNKLEQSC